jgi:hypothetical protein
LVVDAEVVEGVLTEAKGGGETLLEVEGEVFVLENELENELEEGDFVQETESEEDDFVFVTVESVLTTFVDHVKERTDDEIESENTPEVARPVLRDVEERTDDEVEDRIHQVQCLSTRDR